LPPQGRCSWFGATHSGSSGSRRSTRTELRECSLYELRFSCQGAYAWWETKPAVMAGGTWYLALSRVGYRTACPSTLASLVRVRLNSRPAHEASVVYSFCAALSRAFIRDRFDPHRPFRPTERRAKQNPPHRRAARSSRDDSRSGRPGRPSRSSAPDASRMRPFREAREGYRVGSPMTRGRTGVFAPADRLRSGRSTPASAYSSQRPDRCQGAISSRRNRAALPLRTAR
jgi:hypothetical protein